MPRRNTQIITDETYHVFNRTIGGLDVFTGTRNLTRILNLLKYYRFPQKIKYSRYQTLPVDVKLSYKATTHKSKPLIEIYAYAIMPNHYHFLIKQNTDKGITKFTANIQNSYAKYYNLKSNRHGSLFQSQFKAVRIENDEQFSHVSRYIHLNPVTSFLIKLEELANQVITSYPYYFHQTNDNPINIAPIYHIFQKPQHYKQFVSDQNDYQKKLALIEGKIFK